MKISLAAILSIAVLAVDRTGTAVVDATPTTTNNNNIATNPLQGRTAVIQEEEQGSNMVARQQEDTLCVKYTKAVFGEDTADNELALMEAVVNLAVLGDADLQVPGILAAEGGLAPFFTGEAGNTSNRGDMPVSINFLDGAADLPTPDPSSNTSILLSHLYQFFGALLGCNAADFPAYQGDPDMLRVHKFMNLDEVQLEFFNTQVALAAGALGVEEADVTTIKSVLDALFNVGCSPPLTEESGVPSFMVGTQAGICTAPSCPVADSAFCLEDVAPTVAPTSTTVSPTMPVVEDSICVKYTKAVFGEDTAENELTLMETVVNLAVLGDAELEVPGILASEGGLAPFFTGEAGATTNRGGSPVSINFLDGAADLPSPDPSSNTFNLLSHLYQFFGALLGCSASDFPAYQGDPDMYRVHKFMGLDEVQISFFNTQVALAASALGVAEEDVSTIGLVLDSLFNMQCTPPVAEDSGLPDFLVGTQTGICTASSCPVADSAFCPEEETMPPTDAPTVPSTMASPVSSDTICVKYTKAVFGEDTGENQLTLMETVVNLAVLGDAELDVPGILAPEGGLAPFFTGEAGATANRGGSPVSINFLDGGTNPSPTSNTFNLLSHLYQFFGALLGCTSPDFPAYEGDPDMMRVHKFMYLNEDQLNYFNTQVSLAAQALGVELADVVLIRTVLDSLFNVQCSPPLTADTGVPDFMIGTQSGICLDPTCPIGDPNNCPDTMDPTDMVTMSPNATDTLCVKYTKAVFGEDSAENELALMEAVVNLAVLGDAEMEVPGILAAEGGLVPFFTGEAGNTSNRGDMPVSINFLDGAADLPTPDPSSNTFNLLAHLYQFFGGLLGCTAPGFPMYQGDPDMMRVHKFMNLDEVQMDFFNTQVALAASALGVAEEDVSTIGLVLDSLFNVQCTPPVAEDSGLPDFLVGTQTGICLADSCPVQDPTACPGEDSPTAAPSALRGNEQASASSAADGITGFVGMMAIIIGTALLGL